MPLTIDRKPGLLEHGGAGHAILQLLDVLLFHLRFPALPHRTFPA